MRSVLVATTGLTVLLTGCTSTPAEIESKTAATVKTYAQNYQEIYRNTSGTARRCFAQNLNGQASLVVDSELYSDLGYGEVSMSIINWGYRDYYFTAKIEKAGAGARMTARPGPALGSGNFFDKLLRWAEGDQAC